jgi:dihydrofolate reductase
MTTPTTSEVTCDLCISLDGYVTGLDQSEDHPFGPNVGMRLHQWMLDQPDENAAELAAITSAGAYIMGRNMFSPGRGEWDLDWNGWWGDDPPYHAPVFVLTHHPREPLAMDGGTTFTFVTDGIESAMQQARAAAGDGTIAIAGGADAARQYLRAGLIDVLRLHLVPEMVGAGERLLDDVGELKLEQAAVTHTDRVTHLTYRIVR